MIFVVLAGYMRSSGLFPKRISPEVASANR